jgi:hypothetical protein
VPGDVIAHLTLRGLFLNAITATTGALPRLPTARIDPSKALCVE